MNTKQVQNAETPVPKTPQMNERDFLNDMLATEKYMTLSYSVFLHEASHQALYQDMMNIFTETQNCQRELYELMFKKGWYKLEAADAQKLQQTYQQFQGYRSQLPHSSQPMQ
ncbi:spore coat protein [Geobacillus sp. C56-T2]|uniref:spore coat protein n=1 Tax=Geobacillus sp. C56-T2 TaxID=600773 RepID=UPI0011A2ACE4|nr:spore coat protein [Geobacillus sp. C56-T2]NNV07555.1 spore coat protein [Geobacillus sp. MMMUD3]TWG31762.1 coat F domain-containing protein [Geobacillus sp. C56-T2]